MLVNLDKLNKEEYDKLKSFTIDLINLNERSVGSTIAALSMTTIIPIVNE